VRDPLELFRWGTAAALLAVTVVAVSADELPVVSATDAGSHVGERVIVEGRVASAAFLSHLRGEPTFLNLDRPYPNQPFTVVIWGQYRSGFARAPHELFRDETIRVTGTVKLYRDRPQIEVTEADQIELVDPGADARQLGREERRLVKELLAQLGYARGGGDSDWDDATADGLARFRADRGIGEGSDLLPRTLRALAESVDGLSAEQRATLLRLWLLNVAQRETGG